MPRTHKLASAALLAVACAASAASKGPNCDLKAPPKEARLQEGAHGLDLHIYPSQAPKNYNGCQLVWLPDGFKLATLTYKNGKVALYEASGPDEERGIRCVYNARGKLLSAASTPKRCEDSPPVLVPREEVQ